MEYVTELSIEWQDMEFKAKKDKQKEDAKWRLILAVWKNEETNRKTHNVSQRGDRHENQSHTKQTNIELE